MKFGICNEIFYQSLAAPWTLEAAMVYAAKVGYDGIELAPFTLAKKVTDISALERERIREKARKAGIAISGIH